MIYRALLLLAGASVALTACGGGSAAVPSATPGTLSIAMVDTPLSMSGVTVSALDLGVDKIQVIGNGNTATTVATYTTPKVFNLLDYSTGKNAFTFPDATLPAGQYSGLRLLLDGATTTITYTDGTGSHTSAINIPGGSSGGYGNATSTDGGDGQGTVGIKVKVDFTAVSGGNNAVLLDFNAMQSVVFPNGSSPMLKPVIVASDRSSSCEISGNVTNNSNVPVQNAEIDAVQGGTTVNSGVTDANGNFTINALPAGPYTLVIRNQYTTMAGTPVTATNYDSSSGSSLTASGSVNLSPGQTLPVGTIKD